MLYVLGLVRYRGALRSGGRVCVLLVTMDWHKKRDSG